MTSFTAEKETLETKETKTAKDTELQHGFAWKFSWRFIVELLLLPGERLRHAIQRPMQDREVGMRHMGTFANAHSH